MTQSTVATKVAIRLNLKKNLIKAGLTINDASILTGIMIMNSVETVNKVIEELNKLKT